MNYLKQRLDGHGGVIVPNPEGHIGIAPNTPRMVWATSKMIYKEEAGMSAAHISLSRNLNNSKYANQKTPTQSNGSESFYRRVRRKSRRER